MDHEIREQVKEWLQQRVVDLFIAYRKIDGHSLPYVFTGENIGDVEDLVAGPARYPLEKLAWQVISLHPEATVGIVARECDQRALNVLSTWNQVKPGHVKTIPPLILSPKSPSSR